MSGNSGLHVVPNGKPIFGGGSFGANNIPGSGAVNHSPRLSPSANSSSGSFGSSNGTNKKMLSAGASGEHTFRGQSNGVLPAKSAHLVSTSEDGTSTFQDFKSPRAEELLDLIDRLRQNGLSRDVALPKLVFTGNQSSGKSSLLESLTGLPFPSNAETCTRFITKVSIRRAPEIQFKASIISGAQKNLIKTDPGEPSRGQFEDLVKTASIKLGVQESGFSGDILHVEISGPDRNPLSFMDTPGLFVSGSVSQKEEEANVVKELVRQKIRSPRAIIVAVMPATDNTENQSVWSLVKEVDPESLRTVGVLTKCDRVEGQMQELALKVAKNKRKILNHGWWVVRNRSGEELLKGKTLEESRQEEIALFSDKKWSDLPGYRVGVSALKSRLGQLLCDHITQELPNVQRDLFMSLQAAHRNLEVLGPARLTAASQRQHLIEIAELHVKNIKNQLDHKNEGTSSYTFWNRIQKRREKFQATMEAAAKYKLDSSSKPLPSIRDIATFRDYDQSSEFSLLFSDNTFQWLVRRYEDFRGCELPGQIDFELVSTLFKELTKRWEKCSEEHLSEVQSELKKCFFRCLQAAVPDHRMFSILEKHFSIEQEEIIHMLKKDMSRHIERDRSNVSTTNPEYQKRIARARAERILTFIAESPQNPFGGVCSREGLETCIAEPRWTIIELHDMLKTYYDLAVQNVLHNISKQIIDPFILGESSPFNLFNRAYVQNLSEADVEKLAAEPPEVACEREELEKKIKRLSEALEMSAEECPLGIEIKTFLREMQSKKGSSGA